MQNTKAILMVALNTLSISSASKVSHAGVNLFGLAADVSIFGSAYSSFMGTNCNASYDAYPYANSPELYESWRALDFNLFRLPMAWQHVQIGLSGQLNETTMQLVDAGVQQITSNGSVAILDIHNYARWYCAIIGQPASSFMNPTISVTDDDFADLWTKLAMRYRNNTNVMFQLMNEPHDLDINAWAATNQKAINAIRRVTSTQAILVSGTQFARLTDWESSSLPGIGPGLIQDPGRNMLYDFHQYFDDLGGSYGTCEPWSVFAPKFESVTSILRASGFRAILTEFGAGPFPECVDLYEYMLAFLDRNADVWFGWTAWGSGLEDSLQSLSLNTNSTQYALTRVISRFAPSNN